MENIRVTKRMVALVAGVLFASTMVMAGDGTKENPYNVSELNAQKEALAANGNTVWVKADLKGLGEDGQSLSNADREEEIDGKSTTVRQMAALFADATGQFVAYSWQILGQLELNELTNTKDLLMALTYGTGGHAYGNSANPTYASNYEPETPHFSLAELHNALSVRIENGLRGYHFPSSYEVPKNMIAVKVAAGYSTSKGATVSYSNFDGADTTWVTPKDAALVLMAASGTYDIVLSTALYEQTMSNGNSLNPGTQAGVNAGTTKNRARFRFVNEGTKVGFERNSDENCTVTLDSKDEVFLQVSSLESNFWGNWTWETDDKKWISWNGKQYSDFHEINGVQPVTATRNASAIYSLQGLRRARLQKGLNIVGGKKVMR